MLVEFNVFAEGEDWRSNKIHYGGEGNILDELQVYAFVKPPSQFRPGIRTTDIPRT